MITCDQVLKEISNFIDNDVNPELIFQINEHLRSCHNCTVLVNTTRKTLSLVAENYNVELPVGFSERLLAQIAQR